MIGTHQVHLANVGMIPGVNKILKTQYPPHGEKPGINMTQATTAVFFNRCIELYTTSKHKANTSTDAIISCLL